MTKRFRFTLGDCFVIPLGSQGESLGHGRDALGQVLAVEPKALNSVACAFWPELHDDVEKTISATPIAAELVTPDLLKSGKWCVQLNRPVSVPKELCRYEAFRSAGWVGARTVGSGNIRRLLRAYRGLEYWDAFFEPEYLNKFLLPGVEVPKCAIFKVGAS